MGIYFIIFLVWENFSNNSKGVLLQASSHHSRRLLLGRITVRKLDFLNIKHVLLFLETPLRERKDRPRRGESIYQSQIHTIGLISCIPRGIPSKKNDNTHSHENCTRVFRAALLVRARQ